MISGLMASNIDMYDVAAPARTSLLNAHLGDTQMRKVAYVVGKLVCYGHRTTHGAVTSTSTAFDHELQPESSELVHARTLYSMTRSVPAGAVEVTVSDVVVGGNVAVDWGFPGGPLLSV